MAKKLNKTTRVIPEKRLSVRQTTLSAPNALRQNAPPKVPKDAIPVPVSPKDTIPVPAPEIAPVPTFGIKSGAIATYPNDVVRLDLYNAIDVYLGTNYRVDDFILAQPPTSFARQASIGNTPNPTLSATLRIDDNVRQLGYNSGKYKVNYRFHRNILGSGDGHKLSIQEISADRLEVRIIPILSGTLDNSSFISQFQEGLFKTPKSQVLSNLFLFKEANNFTQVFDYVQDKFTISLSPYSIILKLNAPAPLNFIIGDELWLAQQVSSDYDSETIVSREEDIADRKQIAGANFDILAKTSTNISTNYKDKDDLVSQNNTTSYGIQDQLVSSSLVEGINLNTDFRSFKNYITYSSAQSRLESFQYKIQLIDSYDTRIRELTTDLSGLPSSAASASNAFVSNIQTTRARKSGIIGGFDAYEKYLYYESASYESSSYGEFWPTTWPKSNDSKPYINYSATSSQAVSWYEGAIASASLYDNANLTSLSRAVPSFILEDENNETYNRLITVVGHYFDDIIPYIKNYTTIYDRNQSISEGLSKDLLHMVGQSLGFEFENGHALDDLWAYTLGTDKEGSSNTIYNTTVEDTMKETWKRIINNLPYLVKTKGTERGLRALINCFGIPDTILRIREYGGHEGGFDKKSDFIYNRFYYGLTVGYNGQTAGLPAQQINAPWVALNQNSRFPQTTELRVRMAKDQTKDQTILEVPEKWKIRSHKDGNNSYLGFYLNGNQGWATASISSSIYNSEWHQLALRRENQTDTDSDNQTYTLIAKSTNYNKIVTTQTASLYINGSNSASYNSNFTTAGNLWIPGSGSYALTDSHSMDLFSGSVQELRYWTSELEDGILDNHTLTPTSFQGNTDGIFTGSTSSFDTLAYRLTLGSDNTKTLDLHYPATSSFNSQHPNQTSVLPTSSFHNITSSAYVSVIEENSLEWPDLGANRSISTKVRIDSTTLAGNQLYTNTKAEKPLTDNNPPDSARLGIYLAPVNEVNQDIAEQFGGISIDDYIGDPSQKELDSYPDLEGLQREYSKKYDKLNKPNQYVRLLQHYNSALFQLIKQFAPHRANTQTGLLIEPTILERSKIATPPPKVSEHQYTASINLMQEFPPSGEVEDPTNTPQPAYVEAGLIDNVFTQPEGEVQAVIPNVSESSIKTLIGFEANESEYGPVITNPIPINMEGVVGGSDYEQVSGAPIDLAVNGAGWDSRYQGTKYIYMTYKRYVSQSTSPASGYGSGTYGSSTYGSSGGGTVDNQLYRYITASRYDDWQAINPSILTSRFSENSTPHIGTYYNDVYYNKAFASYYTSDVYEPLTSSAALQNNIWTNSFGLRLQPSYNGTNGTTQVSPLNSTDYWLVSGSNSGVDSGTTGPYNGLNFVSVAPGDQPRTGSLILDGFFNEREGADTTNYRYKVSGNYKSSTAVYSTTILLFEFGKFGSKYSEEVTITNPGPSSGTFEFITRADGPQLALTLKRINATTTSTTHFAINNLKIQALNYAESVQDFHLWNSRGMMNARYEGCKLTSTDYNVDSPDTVDNGPVITITEGGGKQLATKPDKQLGTFQIQ